MGKGDADQCVFPLTSLQIGDLQSYLSDLSIFLACESRKFYILVDNRPWLRNLSSRPARIWQLMVTKSRLSPFAKSKARRKRKEGKEARCKSDTSETKKFERWFKLINSANLSRKRVLMPVKKLRNSLLLDSKLHGILHGFIVFEVQWSNVRGINYLNELQTDTSLALEAKLMKRWEFDSIAQAASCLSAWFSGTHSERQILNAYLDSAIGETFHDAQDEFPESSIDSHEEIFFDDLSSRNNSPQHVHNNFHAFTASPESRMSEPSTPPTKKRRVIRSIGTGVEVDFSADEKHSESEDSVDDPESCCASDSDHAIESFQYKDVLILFRFNDHDLPFKLRGIIMADVRLLTLLESGLPSWVIFLQSYPGFCHLYRPWMCPLARTLYVIISVVTVLIGFYDLYKNVPVLKATASHLCGPLFDWIESWEMVSRIKYLGTMLFLHNCQKAIKWFLMVMGTTRSFFSVVAQPFAEPLLEVFECLLPLWNVCSGVVGSFFSVAWFVIESSCSLVENLSDILLQPLWFILSAIWTIGTSILYPIFCVLWEMLYLPIRMVLALGNMVAFLGTSIYVSIIEVWQTVRTIFQSASAASTAVNSYEASMWRVLWNDLFSHVFRAVRSILNGFVAFFSACNRHRLSIYNHGQGFVRRLGHTSGSHSPDHGHHRSTVESKSPKERRRKIHAN
ncbi:uncharacterized protein LOC115750903 [Rhodamnia argentea]|uniref:Uncharacterized protein LOC115750903 n=1 Tax=Rhodamnia argentea TaxID=178133 RepID=A0A8B8QDX9_9MYRT|nr:uncharacterized protein LOC115750903 [Rhodamnia argentea]XP_048137589.1 uncharacterized protein LOC115750903 [Rhodamnia argentea]